MFGQTELDYIEALYQYADATRDRLIHPKTEPSGEIEPPSLWRQISQSRAERHRVLQQRQRENAAWKTAKTDWRKTRQAYQALTRQERSEQRAAYQAAQQAWNSLRQQRRERLQKRQQENQDWHQRNRELQPELSRRGEALAWIALLVVTDNCTRQCLGLPVFRSGAQVSTQEVTAALKAV